MAVAVPATDAQLRYGANQGAAAWVNVVPREFERHWTTAEAVDGLLAGVPAGPRRQMWTGLLKAYVEEHKLELVAALADRRVRAGEQAYAVLCEMTPRPTDQRVVGRGAAADRLRIGAVGGTTVGRELAAMVEDAGKSIEEFAGRAAASEELRARKDAELASACEDLSARIARAQRIKTLVDGWHQRADLLERTSVRPLGKAHKRGRRVLSDAAKAHGKSDRALRAALDRPQAEQEAAVAEAFEAATRAVSAANAELAAHLEALGESMTWYVCGPDDTPTKP